MTVPSSSADQLFMARALELAARGLYTTHPNPRVGCVLVRDGEVVGEGWHARTGEAHAEVIALREAAQRAKGATAYVTLEPCSHTGRTPPCADALIAAGIARTVCAAVDPYPRVAGAGIRRLEAAGIEVSVGLCEAETRSLNVGFFSRFERGRPFVRLKLAMSLDARTAPAAGGRLWITGEAARADVQQWRARSSAVLTGAGTVRIDDPGLDVRWNYGPWIRQPLRVVLDSNLDCAPTSKIFKDGNALIFAAAGGADSSGGPAAVERVPRVAGGLDIGVVLGRLAALEINELLVECGPKLAAAFLEAELVDELILYVAPFFMGADAAPLAALQALRSSGERPAGAAPLRGPPSFEFSDHRLLQDDLRLVLSAKRA